MNVNQQHTPPIGPPVPLEPSVDPEMHWKASRAFGAFAGVGLLLALWLPWLSVSEYRIAAAGGKVISGPGYEPISVTAWAISGSLSFAIAAAALGALMIAARGPLDEEGHWASWAISAYWLCSVVALLAVCAIAFQLTKVPTDLPGTCSARSALATDAEMGRTCANVITGQLHASMLFGAGISVALAMALVGTAWWGTLTQPEGD
jgi:hypothetical protein